MSPLTPSTTSLSVHQPSPSKQAVPEGPSSPIVDAVFKTLEEGCVSSKAWQASGVPIECSTYLENCLNRVAHEFAEISQGISREGYVLNAASKVMHFKAENGGELLYSTFDEDKAQRAENFWSNRAAAHIERWKTDPSFADERQKVMENAGHIWGELIHQRGFKISSEVLGRQEAKNAHNAFARETNPFDEAFGAALSGTSAFGFNIQKRDSAKRKADEQDAGLETQHDNKRPALKAPDRTAPIHAGSSASQQPVLDLNAEKLIDTAIEKTLPRLRNVVSLSTSAFMIALFKENLNKLRSQPGWAAIDMNQAIERYKTEASKPSRQSARLAEKSSGK